VVAGRPAQRVGGRGAPGDEVGPGQRDVGGGAGGRPAPLDQGRGGVEAEPAGPAEPAGRGAGAAADQAGHGEGVGDQRRPRAARGAPLGPGPLEELEQRRLVHGAERAQPVAPRPDHRVPGRGQPLAEQLGPGDPLVDRPHDLAEVHLIGRVVAAVRVAGHHRHRLHAGTLPQPPGVGRAR